MVARQNVSDTSSPRAIPLDEALSIAKQIAEALEAAHEQGIIHRDLTPANIKVRADGQVKVLDFVAPRRRGEETWLQKFFDKEERKSLLLSLK